jgi:hypothetical protein
MLHLLQTVTLLHFRPAQHQSQETPQMVVSTLFTMIPAGGGIHFTA